jgi:hypothetical protein
MGGIEQIPSGSGKDKPDPNVMGLSDSSLVGQSPPPHLPRHCDERQHAHGQTDEQRGNPQVPFDLLLERGGETYSG